MNNNMEKMICPICHKGSMKEGESSYTCDYFKSIDDKCSFIIWKNQHGIVIDEHLLEQLCKDGKTELLKLYSRDNEPYQAKLKVNTDTNSITVFTDIEALDGLSCPKCETRILDMPYNYKCENDNCDFEVGKRIAGVNITVPIFETLLANEKTDFFDFETKKGKEFTAKIYLDNDFKVNFSNELCKCPICKGKMKVWENNYSCENKDFTVWKNQNFSTNLKADDVVQLCTERETKTLSFNSKDNKSYKGKLVLNDDNQIVTVR